MWWRWVVLCWLLTEEECWSLNGDCALVVDGRVGDKSELQRRVQRVLAPDILHFNRYKPFLLWYATRVPGCAVPVGSIISVVEEDIYGCIRIEA